MKALLAGIFAVLIGLILLAGAGLYFYPGALINPGTLGILAKKVLPPGTDPRWSDAKVDVEPLGFLKKKVSVSFSDLCLNVQSAGSRGCFKTVAVSAVLGLEKWKFRIFDLGPVQVLGGDVSVDLARASGGTPGPERGPTPAPPPGKKGAAQQAGWLQFLRDTRLHDVVVAIDSVDVKGPGLDWAGNLKVVEAPGTDIRPPLAPLPELNLEATARESGKTAGRIAVDGRFVLLQPGHEAAGGDLRINHTVSAVFKRGPVASGAEPVFIRFRENGVLSRNLLSVNLSGTARGMIEQLGPVELSDCGIESSRGEVRFSCPIETGIRSGTRIGSVNLMLDGRLESEGLIPSFSRPLRSSLDLKAAASEIDLSGKWDGTVSASAIDGRYSLQLDTVRLRSAFARALPGVELPAPFSVLDGPLRVSSEGALSSTGPMIFNLDAALRLRSSAQVLSSDITAQTRIQAGRGGLTGAVVLNEAVLELPNIDFTNLPRLTADPRITLPRPPGQKRRRAGEESFKYSVRLRTSADSPARLLTRLAPDGVPVALDLTLRGDAPTGGTIDVESFPVQAFRRKAQIDHFRLTLAEPVEDSKIEGKLLVPYTEYTIQAGVFGTVARPQVALSSDPPLPEEKIISVLVFGVPFEDLDTDQESSVASTQSALADRVMGLASLYALGATPVERIGYDPGSGTASIRIRVGQGTSVTVRSRSEETDVGLRKRIGANWVISTDFTSSNRQTGDGALPGSQATVASTFLEWNHRY